MIFLSTARNIWNTTLAQVMIDSVYVRYSLSLIDLHISRRYIDLATNIIDASTIILIYVWGSNSMINDLVRIFGPRRDEVTGEWRKLHN
jgi:hypothetical protein